MLGRNKLVLKFNESHVDIALASNDFGSVKLKKVLSYTPKSDMDENTEGFKELLKDNKIKNKSADIILAVDGIITRLIEVPYMSKKDLDRFIENNKSEYFTVNMSEYSFDYKVVDIERVETKKLIVLLVVFPKSKLKEITSFAEDCGIKPSRITIYPECISDLFHDMKDKSIAIFDSGMDRNNITILDKGRIFLYSGSTYEFSGGKRERYEEILENMGYFLNFYSIRHFGNKVDKLLVIGPFYDDKEFLDEIEEQFAVEAIRGIEDIGVKEIRVLASDGISINNYCDVVGIASKKRSIFNKVINLRETAEEKKERSEYKGIIFFAVLMLCITIAWTAFSTYYVSYSISKYNSHSIDKQLEGASVVDKTINEQNTEKKLYESQLSAINDIKNDSFDYLNILDTLRNELPSNVVISKISVDKEKVDISFNINKSTLDKVNLVVAINRIGIFEPIEINSIKLDDTETDANFTLKIKKAK